MKYIGGGAHIITVKFENHEGFEFGDNDKMYVFTDFELAYKYFKMEVERAMYNHETETDNEGCDIDECIKTQDAVFDKVHITWEEATYVTKGE